MAEPTDTPATPPPRKSSRRKRAATSEPSVRRPGRLASGLALVFATLALIASGYMGYLIDSKRGLSDAKGRLVTVERETAELDELTSKMSEEVGKLRVTQATLTGGLQALQDELGKGRRAWLLAESENLLRIAQHRLAFARDARLALEALRAADQQLAQLGDPQYQPVRKLIETELAALAEYQRQDLAGHARRLGQLASRLDELPITPAPRPAEAPAPADAGFLHEVWADLKGLIRVRSTADTPRPFLLPEQKYYLRENLRLLLLGAQVALLHGDGTTFEQNLRTAQRWLQSYYTATDPRVKTALDEIGQALKAQATSLPALGASLQALQDLRAHQGAK